jgi:hypothetical protein
MFYALHAWRHGLWRANSTENFEAEYCTQRILLILKVFELRCIALARLR